MRGFRLRLLALAALAAGWAAAPGIAQARASTFYSSGAYTGSLTQVVPKAYRGKISFVVSRGKITALTLTLGVACKGLGLVHEKDPVPALTIGIGRAGGFSYVGKVGSGRLRISGILHGRTAVGSFFQTFWLGHDFCTMNRPAFYSATR
jgi:hypothetical protein